MKNIIVRVLSPESYLPGLATAAAQLCKHNTAIPAKMTLQSQMSERIAHIPHMSIHRMQMVPLVIIGASRRFLAQITRHQHDVHFMSASQHFTSYLGVDAYVNPAPEGELSTAVDIAYNTINNTIHREIQRLYDTYPSEMNSDIEGYLRPQGLRNILMMSATPTAYVHILQQRSCETNTAEMKHVMHLMWRELNRLDKTFFTLQRCQPQCYTCKEPELPPQCSTSK